MLKLLSGLVLFHGIHLLPTWPDMRLRVRASIGSAAYLAVFAGLSLLGMVLIASGYIDLRGLARANPQLWVPPSWGRHLALLLMLPASLLIVAAYIPSRVRDRVRHPMLAAILLWALAHLLVRGDAASMLLFGSFFSYAIYDWISVNRRAAFGPLGRRTGAWRGDLAVVAIGAGLYGLSLFGLHEWLIGVAPIRLKLTP